MIPKDGPKSKSAKRKARKTKANDLGSESTKKENDEDEMKMSCASGKCVQSEEIRSKRKVQVLTRTDDEHQVGIASYQIDKWMVDSIDNKEDRHPKNIKNLEVRIDFIGGDHDDNEDVGEELPENFRKAPRVRLEKQKVVKFICTHCKC